MMSDDDILRAAKGLREVLDRYYPDVVPAEMNARQQTLAGFYLTAHVHVGHMKYELDQIPNFLAEGTQSKREKAFRWLSDVGGMMRGPGSLGIMSLYEQRDLFRPESDSDEGQLDLLQSMN